MKFVPFDAIHASDWDMFYDLSKFKFRICVKWRISWKKLEGAWILFARRLWERRSGQKLKTLLLNIIHSSKKAKNGVLRSVVLSLDRNLISAAQLAHYHFLSICNIVMNCISKLQSWNFEFVCIDGMNVSFNYYNQFTNDCAQASRYFILL